MAVPACAGIIIDILVVLILIFSFVGGLKKGAGCQYFFLRCVMGGCLR